MTIQDVVDKVPELETYLRAMPKHIRDRCIVRVHPPGTILHQKNTELHSFGILASGEYRVINEFENGNVFMIERDKSIDFIGDVTILAGMPNTSVTIETLAESIVLYISRQDFEEWISKDLSFLRLVAQKVAFKLYRSSVSRGIRLFYPPQFLLLDYLLKYALSQNIDGTGRVVVQKTRQDLCEETGITVKTLNRTIKKLKEDGLISLEKGKITLTEEQIKKIKQDLPPFI